MRLIQIEQDSPEIVKQAREEIANMLTKMRETPNNLDRQQSRVMHCVGHLSALIKHELISTKVHDQLMIELWQARDKARYE